MFDNVFWVVAQSSFLLGIFHGIMPCGHSWLVLAPFVVGERSAKKVSFLTFFFLLGTTFACILLGLSLGAISEIIPQEFSHIVDLITAIIIIVLGFLLLLKPDIIHRSEKGACNCGHHHSKCSNVPLVKKFAGVSLFSIGFINMIVPCPTAAVMYTYALKSESYFNSVMIFLIYAIATGLAVSMVIWGIYKALSFVRGLEKEGVDLLITRWAGVITIIFGFVFLFLE